MSDQIVAVLRAVRERLTDPRRWVQGTYAGIRTANGVIPFYQHRDQAHANCWCVSTAIGMAMPSLSHDSVETWTELRSEIERELLVTLDELGITDNTGKKFTAAYLYNDDLRTGHAALLTWLDATLTRLQQAA